ncbi:SAM-dependent methyltransferase [Antrihabitans cavernicola]|uniref:Methyltransferase domain-containing protein n=1 Tax=Antrihabitans cavernicola TaxID=2495913 RepID=A0A5A7S273_9NOCA|nr:class I SAM-dependent methyltransferase [Spelaeibacter cavernicola]KAA0017027.1 methyltransferase domain-containing protein [Spelaeibacter cavernicola]
MTPTDYRPPEKQAKRLGRWAREWASFATLPFSTKAPEKYSRLLYDNGFGPATSFGEESMFQDFGYWANSPKTLDEACTELARLVANEAHLSPDDVVIDVGCGYGDQDFVWAIEFDVKEIVGVNVAPGQIEIANARARELGLDGTVRHLLGSASSIPRPDSSGTKVTAMESAFHFPSRAEFFAEAFRVLEPGGRIVTADMIPLPRDQVSSRLRGIRPVGPMVHWLFMPDRKNRPTLAEYRDAMEHAGFVNVKLYSIRDHVFKPYAAFMKNRLRDPEMARVNPAGRIFLGNIGASFWGTWLDYVVASADKPR